MVKIQTPKTSLNLPILQEGNRRSRLVSEAEFRGRIKEMKLPYLRFSPTGDCNADCSFCHNEGQKRGLRAEEARQHNSYLNNNQVDYIARFFAPHFDHVKFTGGEPTLVTNLDELIEIFSNHGYRSSMVSNGILLDDKMQERFREAGLTQVNISLPTLNSEQHAEFFRIRGKLDTVLRNLGYLPDLFDNVKVNFMASRDTVPSQLAGISELSALLGLTVSCLSLVNNGYSKHPTQQDVIDHLARTIGISSVVKEPDNFFVKEIYTLRNGARWEIDDFRRVSYREEAFDNSYCQSCRVKNRCVEGPYALRVGQNGTARTCLIRSDNVVNFGENGFIFKEEEKWN